MKQEFNWGNSSQAFIDHVNKEVLHDKCYETIYPVKPGDVVLDIGASVGPFSWDIMDKVSKVYAFEPSKEGATQIRANTAGYPVEVIQKALGPKTKDNCPYKGWCGIGENSPETMDYLSFQDFLSQYNVDKIDFIKTDCEGGEYFLFKEENMDFLLNSVRNIVGEFHLRRPEHKVEFRYFRDKFLKHFPNFEVRSLDGVDIKWDLWNDHFIEYYNQVIFHISNDA